MAEIDFNFPDGASEGEGGDTQSPLPLPPKRTRQRPVDGAAQTGRIKAEAQAAGLVTTVVVQTPEGYEPEEVKNRTVPMPTRIWDALGSEARLQGKTAKYFVLKGLQMQGFPVTDADLEDKRGSFIKEAAARKRRGEG